MKTPGLREYSCILEGRERVLSLEGQGVAEGGSQDRQEPLSTTGPLPGASGLPVALPGHQSHPYSDWLSNLGQTLL